MKFSIIIATCGRPERLRVTLARVARAVEAHGGGDEVIVVDNSPEIRDRKSEGGDPRSAACGRKSELGLPAVARRAKEEDRRSEVCGLRSAVSGLSVRLLRSKPLNKCAALNVGIAAAENEWLAFTDDDCLPTEDWLVAADGFVEQGVARVFGGRIGPVPSDFGLPTWFTTGRLGLGPGHGSVVRFDPQQSSGTIPNGVRKPLGANFFCRRDVFEDYGLYDEDLWDRCGRAAIGCDDGEMMLRLDRRGEAVGYCAEAVVDHPVYGDRATLRNHLRAAFRLGYRDPIVEEDASPLRWFLRRIVVDVLRSVVCLVVWDCAAAVHYAEKTAVSWGTVICLLRGRKPL